MKYIIEKSFERDAKKLEQDLLHEIQDVVLAIRNSQTQAKYHIQQKR